MTETGFECTAYFRGKDGKGTCDTDCQWWNDGCNMARGSEHYDGKEDEDLTKIMAETQTRIQVVRAVHELEEGESE